MRPMSIQQAAKAIGANTNAQGTFQEVSTDTRNLPKGCLFVARKGEHLDSHQFIASALEQGAAFALAQEEQYRADDRILYVKSTRQALLDLARCYRSQFDIKVVGVTGSVGKTTTKEMIAAVLSSKYKTLKNEGNLNTEVGLPMTLFRLTPEHQAAVVEMGMDSLGEIEDLTLCAQPDVGVITNVGVSHLEKLGSRENILRAKLEITRGLRNGSPLILCKDNDLLKTVEIPRLKVLFYGIEDQTADITAQHVQELGRETSFMIHYQGRWFPARIPCLGIHNIYDALAAFGVGISLGLSPAQAAQALADYVPAGMRQRVVEYKGMTFVEDCYNASPDSMEAALHTMEQMACNGRKIAVFSDMLELGDIAQESHRQVGLMAAQSGVDVLLAYGPLSKGYLQGAQEGGLAQALWFEDRDSLVRHLQEQLKPGDLVWFKASRGMQMERVIEQLRAHI